MRRRSMHLLVLLLTAFTAAAAAQTSLDQLLRAGHVKRAMPLTQAALQKK